MPGQFVSKRCALVVLRTVYTDSIEFAVSSDKLTIVFFSALSILINGQALLCTSCVGGPQEQRLPCFLKQGTAAAWGQSLICPPAYLSSHHSTFTD